MLVNKDAKIAELEDKLAASEKHGEVKFEGLLKYSSKQIGNISADHNYWKDKFLEKHAADWMALLSYGEVW